MADIKIVGDLLRYLSTYPVPLDPIFSVRNAINILSNIDPQTPICEIPARKKSEVIKVLIEMAESDKEEEAIYYLTKILSPGHQALHSLKKLIRSRKYVHALGGKYVTSTIVLDLGIRSLADKMFG
jgi:hypothetical protein